MPHILELVEMDNIVPELSDNVLTRIGERVVREYDEDKDSMKSWLSRNDKALKLVDQDYQIKDEPWEKAANAKLPLVLNAAMKASAEESAEIMRGKKLVQGEVFGYQTDPKVARAERVTKRMNFQYNHELPDWREDHDTMILCKNLLGTVHKKYYFSKERDHCVCELKMHNVVINDNVEHIEDAPRVTEEFELHHWEVEERFRSQAWKRIELSTRTEDAEFSESDQTHVFLEQIRREDLDEDGYAEPYVVTVHKETKRVARIIANYTLESILFDRPAEELAVLFKSGANIEDMPDPVRVDNKRGRVRYVKYDMIPSWEGGYWTYGFGILLSPLNDNCNSLVNQLLDAGSLSNLQSGFLGQQVRGKKGEIRFRPGEWKPLNIIGGSLKDQIVPLPVREPSSTLFQLLGLLMEVLRELSSVTEVMSGEQPRANMAASSILALIEQGKKTFNAIYKRHYRSMKKEFLALFDMNAIYESPEMYAMFLDLPKVDEQGRPIKPPQPRDDFDRAGMDVLPTANPEFSSKVQRLAEAEALLALAQYPETNTSVIVRRYVQSVVDDEEFANEVAPLQPNMTPQQAMEQVQLEMQKFLADAKAREADATAMLATVNLQAAVVKAQMDGVKLPMDVLQAVEKTKQAELRTTQQTYEVDEAEANARRAEKEANAPVQRESV